MNIPFDRVGEYRFDGRRWIRRDSGPGIADVPMGMSPDGTFVTRKVVTREYDTTETQWIRLEEEQQRGRTAAGARRGGGAAGPARAAGATRGGRGGQSRGRERQGGRTAATRSRSRKATVRRDEDEDDIMQD